MKTSMQLGPRFEPSEIGRYVDVSTRHVHEKDMHLLKEQDSAAVPFLVCHTYREGAWVLVPFVEELLGEIKTCGFSAEFIALLKQAREENIDWLKLDADGGEHDGFPTFEW